jgi:hypothetical protein
METVNAGWAQQSRTRSVQSCRSPREEPGTVTRQTDDHRAACPPGVDCAANSAWSDLNLAIKAS